ncbi:MAG: hypothetical protein QM534_10275 [Sediminibacterium sp.]|nr:hypothetical protein [Sediminibacterium sp.]
MENKFKVGAYVYAINNPAIKLIIRRYVDKIYYCRIDNSPESKDLVYFEREITDNENLQYER